MSDTTLAIWSGVAIAASNSSQPPWIFSIRSSLPTTSAPAACACSALSPTANTATRAVLPVPCGRLTVPRTIWSDRKSTRQLQSHVNLVCRLLLEKKKTDDGFHIGAATRNQYDNIFHPRDSTKLCSKDLQSVLITYLISAKPTGGNNNTHATGPNTPVRRI